jgi:hypothetical protein
MNARALAWQLAFAALAASPLAALAPEPQTVEDALRSAAARHPHLRLEVSGHSTQGRPLLELVATARPAAIESQIRLLVLARQHGDESAPADAALLWLAQQGVQPAAFERVCVILLPTVNPDGAAAGSRANGAGVDLNRDWAARSQPETRWVESRFEHWQPHLVLDLHTFTGLVRGGRRLDSDWIETCRCGSPGVDRLGFDLGSDLATAQRALGERCDLLQTRLDSGIAPTLCHRWYASAHHCPSWLAEVGDQRPDPQARLLSLLVDRLDGQAETLKPRLDALRALAGWTAPRLAGQGPAPEAESGPEPAPALPPGPPVSPFWIVAAYGWAVALRAKLAADPDDV